MELPLHNIIIATSIHQLWWIAVWGIAYLGIEFIARGSKALELKIYILLLAVVWITLVSYPELHKQF